MTITRLDPATDAAATACEQHPRALITCFLAANDHLTSDPENNPMADLEREEIEDAYRLMGPLNQALTDAAPTGIADITAQWAKHGLRDLDPVTAWGLAPPTSKTLDAAVAQAMPPVARELARQYPRTIVQAIGYATEEIAGHAATSELIGELALALVRDTAQSIPDTDTDPEAQYWAVWNWACLTQDGEL